MRAQASIPHASRCAERGTAGHRILAGQRLQLSALQALASHVSRDDAEKLNVSRWISCKFQRLGRKFKTQFLRRITPATRYRFAPHGDGSSEGVGWVSDAPSVRGF